MRQRVYFLRPIGMEGPVKIGCSSMPAHRLEAFLPWSPFPLEIAAEIEGDMSLEASFHTHFSAHHSHREWFHACPEITATIEAINASRFDTATLPKGTRVSGPRTHRWTAETRLGVRLRHAVDRLQASGVDVPLEIEVSAKRYALHGLAIGWPRTRKPGDAMAVREFLAPHIRAVDPKGGIAALALECGVEAA